MLLQQFENLNAVAGGVSQPIAHAPVATPVNGSWHGAHLLPVVQLDCSSVDWLATIGRHVDKQRPGAVVPENAVHDGSFVSPAVLISTSGVQ